MRPSWEGGGFPTRDNLESISDGKALVPASPFAGPILLLLETPIDVWSGGTVLLADAADPRVNQQWNSPLLEIQDERNGVTGPWSFPDADDTVGRKLTDDGILEIFVNVDCDGRPVHGKSSVISFQPSAATDS